MLAAPRWTHVALPCSDLDASVTWYERFTPLRTLSLMQDEHGRSVWLAHPGQVVNPFVLVLVMFNADRGRRQPQLAPFAHLGMELPAKDDVDRAADEGRAAGCLAWEPQSLPPPVGYVCALTDPDGNVVEFSFDQGVHDKVEEVWGS